MKNIHKIDKNIYTTSDEEIKEGNYFIGANKVVYKFTSDDVKNGFKPKGEKITLTTDPELIKDGVQAIDDEFLEWFVKNPSCEYIKTEKWLDDEGGVLYSRIIPKEEPKQDKKMYSEEQVIYILQELCYDLGESKSIVKEWFETFKNK